MEEEEGSQIKMEPMLDEEIPFVGLDDPMSMDDHMTLTMLESILSDEGDPFGQNVEVTEDQDKALSPEAAARAEAAKKRSARVKKKAEKKKGIIKEETTFDLPALGKIKKTKMEEDWSSAISETSKSKDDDEDDKKNLTEEEKKQRRLIRNRLSAQLHRERKRAYVDHLEGLVRERDERIRELEEEAQKLRLRNSALEAQLVVATVSSDEEQSQSDDHSDIYLNGDSTTEKSRKRPRTTSRLTTALLAAVSCIALFSHPAIQLPRETPPYLEDTHEENSYASAVVVPHTNTRRKLLAGPLPAAATPAPESPPPSATPDKHVGYERIVERELFSYDNVTLGKSTNPPPPSTHNREQADLPINVTRALLRGGARPKTSHNATMAVAPYSAQHASARRPAATSYVVCSKAAGVFARDPRFPTGPEGASSSHGALLSLPDPQSHDFETGPGFVQLLVPLPDLDASAWGYSAPSHDDTSEDGSPNDLWLELGAHLAYGRLVHDVKFTL